ncbi:MAG: hypothetical protein ACI8Z5_001463 [Lentimonas sp.]|jgi:hypothetical protein
MNLKGSVDLTSQKAWQLTVAVFCDLDRLTGKDVPVNQLIFGRGLAKLLRPLDRNCSARGSASIT